MWQRGEVESAPSAPSVAAPRAAPPCEAITLADVANSDCISQIYLLSGTRYSYALVIIRSINSMFDGKALQSIVIVSYILIARCSAADRRWLINRRRICRQHTVVFFIGNSFLLSYLGKELKGKWDQVKSSHQPPFSLSNNFTRSQNKLHFSQQNLS